MNPNPPTLNTADILNVIKQAKHAELCRDVFSLQKILQNFLTNNDCLSQFREFEPKIRGELLRLYGFYLTFYGRSQNLKDFQIRAKDVLTNAVEIFDLEGLPEKSAEAKIILAFCFWNNGEVSECEALLKLVELDFQANKLHPVYLQLKINQMMLSCWSEKNVEALAIVEEIAQVMDFCSDSRLRIMFHFEAAILFHHVNRHHEAIFHFTESIRICEENGNLHLLALTYNNFSLLYNDMKLFDEAHDFSVRSVELLIKLEHIGWIPHILDSRALIYYNQHQFENALIYVEKALKYFYKGEDYKGLTATLWTKTLCLMRLNKMEDALEVFADLKAIAAERIGKVAVDKFTKAMAKELYPVQNLPLSEEVAEFKKSRVRAALIRSNLRIGDAAAELGLKSHQTLSDMLNKQFPELIKELGIPKRAPRKDRRKLPPKEVKLKSSENRTEISRTLLSGKTLVFETNIEVSSIKTYLFRKQTMKKFGIDFEAVVAVIPISQSNEGMNILLSAEKKFIAGRLQFDRQFEFFYVEDENGFPIPIDGEMTKIIGSPVEYAKIEDSAQKIIKFSKLA